MKENKLVTLLEGNEEVFEKIKNADNKDEVMKLISSNIEGYTEDDVKEDLKEIVKMIKLDDDKLSQVSGGGSGGGSKGVLRVDKVSNEAFVSKLIGYFGLIISII